MAEDVVIVGGARTPMLERERGRRRAHCGPASARLRGGQASAVIVDREA